ncbi:MAG: Ldh family oxidoreductase, partial [Armatimonadetes bacterium]|nr:Ldh family oxidoreductase [Armatimonadota bacterium]
MNIQAEQLRAFCQRVLEKVDVPAEHAVLIATVLVETDLRGVTSHGTSLLPRYVRRFQTGLTNPRPRMQIIGQRGATALVDGDTGLGHVVSHFAMERAIGLARAHAMGMVAVRNSTHFGMAGYYAMMAAREGMIGYATSNAGADMAPWQGREPALGNNPIAYAIPAGEYPDIVLDMACSVAAAGRIRVAQLKGEQIPRGWVVGDHTDPAAAMKAPLMPFGAHKGSGLAVVGEILSAVLPGAVLGIEVAHTQPVGGERRDPRGIGHCFM